MNNYVIAYSKGWFRNYPKSEEFKKLSIHWINSKKDLNLSFLDKLKPKFIFLPHWSWIIEKEIFSKYECIAFHTSPLPYGRGGSPIQNLIIKGFKESPVCALRVEEGVDSGPIYSKLNISLEGNLEDIFRRLSNAVEKLIIEICNKKLIPKEQNGDEYVFRRLNLSDNKISTNLKISEIYDRIRMVDGQDYTNAYMDIGDYRLYFSDAKLKDDKLTAKVIFKNNKNIDNV